MANENIVFDIPKMINLNSSSSTGNNDSSGNSKILTDTETVKIEVMEEDDPEAVNLLEEDDGVKIETFSDQDEDDQPLTQALAKEMES